VHENDLMSYVSAMRKREDEAFLKQMRGARMVDLNLKDAPIRLRCDAATVCDIAVNPDDPAIAKIHKAVANLMAAARGKAALVLPLALGNHIDHRVVRDACLPLTPDLPCAFYEDLPYAMREGVRVDLARFREDAASHWHEPLEPVVCRASQADPVEFKRKLAGLYGSQIDDETAVQIAHFAERYDRGERLWANPAWRQAAEAKGLSEPQPDAEVEPLPA
jgi:hypothetical protein